MPNQLFSIVALAATAFATSTTTVTSTTTITNTVLSTAGQCSISPVVTATVLTTATATTTSTVTPPCSVPTNCGNSGLQYAYMTVPVQPSSSSTNIYSGAYDPAAFKSQLSSATNGTTPEILSFATNVDYTYINVYGKSVQAQYFLLNHRGYFFAPQTGAYTFTFPMCDDKCFLWVGPDAYAGYDAANADDYVDYRNLSTNTVTKSLTQNTFTPFRLWYTQGNGPANISFTITAPDGTPVAQPGDAGTYFVQSCGSSAPAYPAWGSEM